MPHTYSKTSRRHFIRVIAGGAGAIATMGIFSSSAPPNAGSIKVALISDTHISKYKKYHSNGFYPFGNLQKVVCDIKDTDVQTVIFTGDLARIKGRTGDYKKFRKAIDPLIKEFPVALILGNHDRHKSFDKIFPQTAGKRQDISGKFVNVLEYPDMRFILLDSLDKCPDHGFLGKAQRDWLNKYLHKHKDKPVILFVHHTFKDNDTSLIDADRLFKIIMPQKHVKAIVYGHSHSYNFTKHGDIHLINIPSTAYYFKPSEPVGWVEASFTTGGGTFKLHAIGGNMDNDKKVTTLKWR